MHVPQCNRPYDHPTVALHLHDYAGVVWIGENRFRLELGDMTISPSQVVSSYEVEESGQHLCVHFFPLSPGRPAERVDLPLHVRLGARAALVRERFWRVIDYHWQSRQKKDSAVGSAASASLQEMLLWLYLQRDAGQASSREDALTELRTIMDASLAKPLTVPELTAKIGLSADYASRLFRQKYGMTIPHYLLLKRIELARHLLVSSDLPVREVGKQSGIPDPQYFNKQFRRVTGQSPRAYSRLMKR